MKDSMYTDRRMPYSHVIRLLVFVSLVFLAIPAMGQRPLAAHRAKDTRRADRSLNLIEQINQTFTHLASAQATRWLFQHHPDAAPFRLNLGTAGGTDIESIDGSVGAETFGSVDPTNNRKLDKDIDKVGVPPPSTNTSFTSARETGYLTPPFQHGTPM